jgi:hypothetical protein
MKPRRAIVAICTLLALTLVAGPSALAASKAKKPTPPKFQTSGVWVGQIERHGKHYDYVGSPCPVDAGGFCITQVVRYRINPKTAEARSALKNYKGGQGAIWAERRPAKDRGHDGLLVARDIGTGSGAPSQQGQPGIEGGVGLAGANGTEG